jgi:tetratricopeptide (TPR) repeat protein
MDETSTANRSGTHVRYASVDPHPEPPPLTAGAWPSPPPAPPPLPQPAAYPTRRWPIVLLLIAAVVMAATGAVLGTASGTAASASTAAALAAHGNYANAIAVDGEIAQRTGPLHVIDSTGAGNATRAAEETVMAWAAALGREGQVDSAVALYRTVTAPALRGSALDALAALLLKTATQDAAQAQYPLAIERLQEITRLAPATPSGRQVSHLLHIEQAGEAGLLITAGRAGDAVAMLNTVVAEHSAQATKTADSLFPSALLAAGEEDLGRDGYLEAVSAFDQLVTAFPSSAEAALAQSMLAAPQTVTGTLVTHVGMPISDKVRLSSNYKSEPGGMYQTSGPFYSTTADASGDFSFSDIPVGGPYVLEVFSGGNWTTLINPNTNEPADPVMVAPLVPVDLTFVVLSS